MIPQILCYTPVSLDTAVFLLSKKESLQCLTKTKSVFCMFSRAKNPEKRVIEHTLAATQTLVGGGIETVYPCLIH